MKRLILFVLVVGLVGIAQAKIVKLSNGLCVDTETNYVVACNDGSDNIQTSTFTATIDLEKAIQENICPSGWKESEYFLMSAGGTVTTTLLYEPVNSIKSPKTGNVEVCPDNGLIRVKK